MLVALVRKKKTLKDQSFLLGNKVLTLGKHVASLGSKGHESGSAFDQSRALGLNSNLEWFSLKTRRCRPPVSTYVNPRGIVERCHRQCYLAYCSQCFHSWVQPPNF